MRRRDFIKYTASGTVALMLGGLFSKQALSSETIVLGGGPEGTQAHAVYTAKSKVFHDERGIDLIYQARTSTSAAFYDVSRGRFHGCHGDTTLLAQSWANRGAFSEVHVEYPPYHGIGIWNGATFIVVPEDSDIETWEDLRGKRVYPIQAGFGTYEALKAGLMAAGIWDDIIEVQMDIGEGADALSMGVMDACGAYVGGLSLPSWNREIDARMDVRVIPPLPEHIKMMEENLANIHPGTFIYEVPVQDSWTQDVALEKVKCPTTAWCTFLSQHMSEELAYEFGSNYVELIDTLYEFLPEYKELHMLRLKLTYDAYAAVPDLPVHPGMAMVMKEEGMWNERFKIGEVKT